MQSTVNWLYRLCILCTVFFAIVATVHTFGLVGKTKTNGTVTHTTKYCTGRYSGCGPFTVYATFKVGQAAYHVDTTNLVGVFFRPSVGSTIPIYYDEENPNDAQVGGLLLLWQGVMITGSIAFVLHYLRR